MLKEMSVNLTENDLDIIFYRACWVFGAQYINADANKLPRVSIRGVAMQPPAGTVCVSLAEDWRNCYLLFSRAEIRCICVFPKVNVSSHALSVRISHS